MNDTPYRYVIPAPPIDADYVTEIARSLEFIQQLVSATSEYARTGHSQTLLMPANVGEYERGAFWVAVSKGLVGTGWHLERRSDRGYDRDFARKLCPDLPANRWISSRQEP